MEEQLQLPGLEDVHKSIGDEAPAPETGYKIDPPPNDEHNGDDHEHVMTAFVVWIKKDGKAVATTEYESIRARVMPGGPFVELSADRDANLEDMRRACQEVVEDLRITLLSNATVALQMAAAQQQMANMQRAAEAQRIAQHLDLGRSRG